MTDSFSLRALKALTASLKTITIDNGYEHDLADYDPGFGDGIMQPRVFRGRPWFGDNDPIPMLSVLEWDEAEFGPAPATDSEGGAGLWNLMVQGFVNDDPVNPTDPAYGLAADVIKRLLVEKRRKAAGTHTADPFGMGLVSSTGGNAIEAISWGRPVVRPADDVSSKAYFWLRLTLKLVEGADPYA